MHIILFTQRATKFLVDMDTGILPYEILEYEVSKYCLFKDLISMGLVCKYFSTRWKSLVKCLPTYAENKINSIELYNFSSLTRVNLIYNKNLACFSDFSKFSSQKVGIAYGYSTYEITCIGFADIYSIY